MAVTNAWGAGGATGGGLLQALQSTLRVRHMSRRTEAAYVYWTRRFVRFAGLRHTADLGIDDVRRFLSHLAVDQKRSASTNSRR